MSSAWTAVIRLTRLSYRCSIEPLIAAAMVNTVGTGSNAGVGPFERVIRGWIRLSTSAPKSESYCLKSSRNSDAGSTPVIRRWSRARVHATYSR